MAFHVIALHKCLNANRVTEWVLSCRHNIACQTRKLYISLIFDTYCYVSFNPPLLQTKLANGTSSMIVPKQRKLSASYEKEKELCVKYFEQWSESDQVEFVEHLISQMCHYQHGHINSYLKPMLQRDFITALPGMSMDVCEPLICLEDMLQW